MVVRLRFERVTGDGTNKGMKEMSNKLVITVVQIFNGKGTPMEETNHANYHLVFSSGFRYNVETYSVEESENTTENGLTVLDANFDLEYPHPFTDKEKQIISDHIKRITKSLDEKGCKIDTDWREY